MKRVRRVQRILCGLELAPGRTQEGCLKISESFLADPVNIPVTIVSGREPGPTAFVFGGVHGNEINGVDIVRHLIYDMSHEQLCGTLVLVPVVNVQGFLTQSRYLPYHRDLNRCFPGKLGGNNAQQIAARLFNEIVLQCDFGIDLHTAGDGRTNLPQVRGDLSNRAVRKLAQATGAAILVDQPGDHGTLRRAATQAGVPTILFEAGEPGRFDPRVSRAGLKGVLNVLHAMKMWPEEPRLGIPFKPPFQAIVRKRHWMRARHGGILDLAVAPGQIVYEGDVVATVLNPFGKLRRRLRAPMTAMVIGTTTQPLAAPGTAVVHLASLGRSLSKIERLLATDKGPFSRPKAA